MKAIPLWIKIAGPVLLLAAIVAGFKACTATTNHKTDAVTRTAREAGAAEGRAAAAEEGVRDVIKSNEARQTVDRDARARYDVCVRTSRTPAACRPPAAE